MWVVGAFMAFKAGCCDVKYYQLKWLRVHNYVIGLGFKSYVCPIMCYLIYNYFNNVLDHDE